MEIPSNVKSSVHLAIIRLKNKDPIFHRYLFEFLRDSGIGVQVHYIPVHTQPYYKNLGFQEGNFPCSEDYSKNAISIPLFPGLSDEDQEYVVSKIEGSSKFILRFITNIK